jgi:hypothetical protein
MSSPPSSPLVSHDAIVALQNAATDPTTPAASNAAAIPVALAFEYTSKRHSSDDRDAAVDGVNSPIKKRPDTRLSPRKRVAVAADEAIDMDIELILVNRMK